MRASQTLASGESDQVETHLGVIPEIRNRRNVGSRVIETWDAMLVGHTHPVFAADLALTSIKKVGHHCAIGKSLLVLRKGFDFNKTDAAIADGMVVSIAMSLLNDDFVF